MSLSRRALVLAAIALPLPVWANPRPKTWAQPVTPAEWKLICKMGGL